MSRPHTRGQCAPAISGGRAMAYRSAHTIVRSIGTTCRHTSAGIVTNYGGALLWSNGLSMKVDEVHDNKGDNHSD